MGGVDLIGPEQGTFTGLVATSRHGAHGAAIDRVLVVEFNVLLFYELKIVTPSGFDYAIRKICFQSYLWFDYFVNSAPVSPVSSSILLAHSASSPRPDQLPLLYVVHQISALLVRNIG